jgi:glycerophosphoryl diester phosphodiesterase
MCGRGVGAVRRLQDLFENEARIAVAGHRGIGAVYPENTILSYQKAAEAGVDMIEIDVHLTRDGHLVLMHDDTVDRTTDGSGRISEMALSQFLALDAGARFSAQYAGEHPPTLEAFCEWAKAYPGMLFNVEIKRKTREVADKIVDMLRVYGMLEKCVFACFDAAIIDYLYDEYHLLTQGFPAEKMKNFTAEPNGTYSKMYAVGIDMSALTPERVAEFDRMGIMPWCYCPDKDAQVLRAIECGARLHTVNDPFPSLRILSEKGLR